MIVPAIQPATADRITCLIRNIEIQSQPITERQLSGQIRQVASNFSINLYFKEQPSLLELAYQFYYLDIALLEFDAWVSSIRFRYGGWPPQLSGFICAYHPAAPGSNPKHTIYAFFNLYRNCNEKRTKIKKRPGLPIFKKRFRYGKLHIRYSNFFHHTLLLQLLHSSNPGPVNQPKNWQQVVVQWQKCFPYNLQTY